MNILYLCADPGIPIRGHKGAAVHVRSLADAFVEAGHTVTLFTPRPGPADGPVPLARIVECPLPNLPVNTLEQTARREQQAQAYAGTLTVAALAWLAENPCDFIYERYSLWSDVGARLRATTGLPLVLEVNAPLRREAAAYRSLSDDKRTAEIEATQFGAANFLVAVSEPIAAYAIARGADPARVHVLPNGVDPQHFHPAVRGGGVRRRYGLHGRIVVGFAGRLRPWHDGPTLLRAFARLHTQDPAYHLLLVGEMSPEILENIAAAGLKTAVTCTGPVPHTAVPEHLAAMDVAVCSHAPAAAEDFYFSPLKLFEYLACGVPTVAAAVGQPCELVRPGHNGYLYPPGEDAALADAIRRLVEDPAHAREVAWNGAALVLQNYTWAQNAARVLDWLAPAPVAGEMPGVIPLPILDLKLRQRLYRASRADLAAPLLARRLADFGKKGPYRLKRIKEIMPLKYKQGRRCVLAYKLYGCDKKSGRRVQQQVIGKVFRDGRGQRLLKLQALLYKQEFGSDATDGIHVPQPLTYVPEMRMLVQAAARGETLHALAWRGDVGPQVRRCAEGLAKLHRSRAFLQVANSNGRPLLKSYALADELRGLEQYKARLADLRPETMPQIEVLHTALCHWAERLPAAATAVPLHRDFYYSQVLFDGPRLYLIDFDLLALGDAAVDVANFTAHLAYIGLEQGNNPGLLAGEIDDFTITYMARSVTDTTFMERVAFYQAATFFRLLNVIAPRPALQHLFAPLLAHTQAVLGQTAGAEAIKVGS